MGEVLGELESGAVLDQTDGTKKIQRVVRDDVAASGDTLAALGAPQLRALGLMETVYRLRDDSESIRSMQSASLGDSKWAGLRNTHGLVASSAWWSAIESGALALHSVDGVISGFWPGQGGGGPAEFQLQQPSGEKTMWLCGIDPMLAKRLFQIGRKATVQYVCQKLKNPFEGRDETKLTISISLG